MYENFHGNETILVADDEPLVLSLTASILKVCGYHVLVAPNGNEAVDSYGRQEKVDLVLTDIIMPVMTGPELVHKLRQINPDLRCVYMSGYDQSAIQERIGNKVCDYLRKPFTPAALLEKIRNTLDAKPEVN